MSLKTDKWEGIDPKGTVRCQGPDKGSVTVRAAMLAKIDSHDYTELQKVLKVKGWKIQRIRRVGGRGA